MPVGEAGAVMWFTRVLVMGVLFSAALNAQEESSASPSPRPDEVILADF